MNYISWCFHRALIPPRDTICLDKYEFFIKEFEHNGWGRNHPALIGYFLNLSKVQLINGTNRYHAAKALNLLIPTVIYEKEYIENIWGTDDWIYLVNNPMLVY